MVKRNRNQPSVIMWSLFNEEFYRDQYQGTNIYTTLASIVRRLDPTRPHIFGAIGFGGLPYRGETRYPYLFSGDDSRSTFHLLCDPLPAFYKERAQWKEQALLR